MEDNYMHIIEFEDYLNAKTQSKKDEIAKGFFECLQKTTKLNIQFLKENELLKTEIAQMNQNAKIRGNTKKIYVCKREVKDMAFKTFNVDTCNCKCEGGCSYTEYVPLLINRKELKQLRKEIPSLKFFNNFQKAQQYCEILNKEEV